MAGATPNYGLVVYNDTTDKTTVDFSTYRKNVAGVETTSNMGKIDTQMKVNADAIASVQSQVDTIETGDSNALIGVYKVTDAANTDDYIVTYSGLTLFDGLRLNVEVSNQNTGDVTVNLNALGAIGVVSILDTAVNELNAGEMAGINELQYSIAINKFIHLDVNIDVAKIDDESSNRVVSGLSLEPSGTLSTTITPGVAYINGVRVTTTSQSPTLTASKDTYVDLSELGVFTYNEVALGGAEPAITANSIRIAKAITDATSITEVQRSSTNLCIGFGAGVANENAEKNTFIGFNAGNDNTDGSFNSFLGYFAGDKNTVGSTNTFIGYGCGRANVDGNSNTFIGYECGHLNVDGTRNVAIGYHAGAENVSGIGNVTIGYESGEVNTADFNVFIGNGSGKNNTDGLRNTFLGTQSGGANIGTDDNTFIGYQAGIIALGTWNTGLGSKALALLTSGLLNTAIGYNAGSKVTTGGSNTFVGAGAGNDASQKVNASNTTAIGNGAFTQFDNTIQLGNTSVAAVYTHGNLETQDVGNGFVCKSPDSTRWKITVDNAGAIVVAAA